MCTQNSIICHPINTISFKCGLGLKTVPAGSSPFVNTCLYDIFKPLISNRGLKISKLEDNKSCCTPQNAESPSTMTRRKSWRRTLGELRLVPLEDMSRSSTNFLVLLCHALTNNYHAAGMRIHDDLPSTKFRVSKKKARLRYGIGRKLTLMR